MDPSPPGSSHTGRDPCSTTRPTNTVLTSPPPSENTGPCRVRAMFPGGAETSCASDRWTIKTRPHKQLLPPDSWCCRACPSLCPFSLLPPFPLTPSLPTSPPFAVQSLSYYSLLASVKRFHFVDTMKTGRIHYLALHSSHPPRRTAPLQPNRTLHPPPLFYFPTMKAFFCCYGAVFSVL